MSNLFTEQIINRTQTDEAMLQAAESMIDDSVLRKPTGDVLAYAYSNRMALKKILSLCGISEDRLNYLDREDILFTRVESDPAWFKHQTGYCIAVDTEDQFIAVLPGKFGGYYFYDEQGTKVKADAKSTSNFTKVYCVCRLLPKETLTIFSLLEYLMSFMRQKVFGSYIILSVIAGILGLIFPSMINHLMGSIEKSPDILRNSFISISILCLLAELIRLLMNIALALFESDFTTMVSYNVKNAVLIRYLSETGNPQIQQGASETWFAINNNIPEFIDNLLSSGLNLIPHLTFTLCYCVAAAIFLGKTSIWMFLILALFALAMWFVGKGFDLWYTRALKTRIIGDNILFQAFKGIEKIRSRQAQKRVYHNWATTYSDEAYFDKQRKGFVAMATSLQDLVTPLMSVVLILALITHPIPYSNLMTGTLLAGLLAGQVADLTFILERLVNSKSMWQMISFLFDGATESEKKTKCTEFSPRLNVQKVSFSYPGMERLLDNISFSVKEGEYIGIVGVSGCGKSTLLKLLLGILKPNKGEISYGQYDLSTTDQRSLLRNIGIVLQNESLIPGTIRQNMMMQPTPVSEEDIWQILEKVGIADLIRSYPSGLDTEIGVSGATLSGGQMQKLLIARAIITNPKMIVFDEATSALDNISQREIKDLLDEMKCTRIVVAHRLSTVKDCDRILLLENGHITQQGTYDELVAQEGLFRELVKCQGALE